MELKVLVIYQQVNLNSVRFFLLDSRRHPISAHDIAELEKANGNIITGALATANQSVVHCLAALHEAGQGYESHVRDSKWLGKWSDCEITLPYRNDVQAIYTVGHGHICF
jgi:hypothetical protein